MSEPAPPPPPPARAPAEAWARAFTVVAIAAMVVGAAVYIFWSMRQIPGEAAEGSRRLLRDLGTVASAFRQGTIETTFTSYATTVTGSNYLQFATLRQTETYTRSDAASLLWGTLELPEVVVSATAPVEYTYYLDLDDPWTFRLADGRLTVETPQIRFNRPAIDATEIRYEVRASSLLRDEEAALVKLKRGLTEMSVERARGNVGLVRELGRQKVREFVRNWLAGAFDDGGGYAVEVVFADERPQPLEPPGERGGR